MVNKNVYHLLRLGLSTLAFFLLSIWVATLSQLAVAGKFDAQDLPSDLIH